MSESECLNIVDYLKWRGDLPFYKDGFNEVDNLVLCQLCYTDLDDLLKENESMTIEEIARWIDEMNDGRKGSDLFHEAAQTRRFNKVKVTHYVSVLDQEKTLQFAAMCFDISSSMRYVCFRGTDTTLIGWKENFMMLYQVVGAQVKAAEYLEQIGKEKRKLIIGGHSKGGNLALYAAMNASNRIKKRMIAIYNNDGPEINPQFFDEHKFRSIEDRYIQIVVEEDEIGQIFHMDHEQRIILSSEKRAYAHDPYSWLVCGNHFVLGEKLTGRSVKMKRNFDAFLSETSPQERKEFADQLFVSFMKVGIDDSKKLIGDNRIRMINTYKIVEDISQSDVEIRNVAAKFLNIFTSVYGNNLNRLLEKGEKRILKAADTVNDI